MSRRWLVVLTVLFLVSGLYDAGAASGSEKGAGASQITTFCGLKAHIGYLPASSDVLAPSRARAILQSLKVGEKLKPLGAGSQPQELKNIMTSLLKQEHLLDSYLEHYLTSHETSRRAGNGSSAKPTPSFLLYSAYIFSYVVVVNSLTFEMLSLSDEVCGPTAAYGSLSAAGLAIASVASGISYTNHSAVTRATLVKAINIWSSMRPAGSPTGVVRLLSWQESNKKSVRATLAFNEYHQTTVCLEFSGVRMATATLC